jgi:hypothetical protein
MMDQAELDRWIPDPSVRVAHRRHSRADPERLWRAASVLRLDQTRLLGRLIRWRIPGIPPGSSFDELFRNPPFCVLHEDELGLLSGLVGKIWTLRRDYPRLGDPEEFRSWDRSGTVRVLFANWVDATGPGATLHSETRVQALGVQGRIGLAGVRPLISSFQNLVGTEAISGAVQAAERS